MGAIGAHAAGRPAHLHATHRPLPRRRRARSGPAHFQTVPAAASARIEAELDAAATLGAGLIASCEPDYPPLLAQLEAPLRPHSVGTLFDERSEPPPPGLPGKIAALLSPTPIHVNDLARLVGAGVVATALTELEPKPPLCPAAAPPPRALRSPDTLGCVQLYNPSWLSAPVFR